MSNALTRKQWAQKITKTWYGGTTTMVDAIIAVARELEQAKEELGYGEYMVMFEKEEVPFSSSKGRRFKAIADNAKILECSQANILPPDWTTLYLLTQVAKRDPGLFDQLVEDGTINSAMARADIAKVLRRLKMKQDEQRVLDLVPTVGKFRTLVIDPAWDFGDLSIAGRAAPDYALQTLDELRKLDLRQWADEQAGCQLYCWVTNNFISEGCKLIELWGFQHRTIITWIKTGAFGLGSYFRNSTEHVLFATLGDTTTRPVAASIPTHFEAPRGGPSEKPERFYEIVRAASYPPYGEGNQRQPRPGFTNLFEMIEREKIIAAE